MNIYHHGKNKNDSFLVSMFQGRVLSITKRHNSCKLILGVEIGRETVIYSCRTRLPLDLKEDVQVVFTGYELTHRGKRVFVLQSISKQAFKTCRYCELPLTTDFCDHSSNGKKISGHWKVVHKSTAHGVISLFFTNEPVGSFVFGADADDTRWNYELLSTLTVGDIVELKGWRYINRSTLRYIKKI